MLLADLVKKLAALKGKKWRKDSVDQHFAVVKLLARFCGDSTIHALTKENIAGYFSLLNRLPRHYSKRPEDHLLSLDQLIAKAAQEGKPLGLSPATVNRNVTHISAIVRHAEQMGYIAPLNIDWKQYNQTDDRSDDEKRTAFTCDQVRTILNHLTWTKPNAKTPLSSYWIPLLASYFGARMGEIAGLRVEDIDVDKQTILIQPTPDRPLKTKESHRKLPLPPELIRLGFLHYVNAIKELKREDTLLFIDLGGVTQRKSCADRFQKKWLKILNETIIDAKSKELCFYSYRHYVSATLIQAGVPDGLVQPYLGHVAKTLHGRTYTFSRKSPPENFYNKIFDVLPNVSQHIQPQNWPELVGIANRRLNS